MYILKKILGLLKKTPQSNEEEVDKYIKRIRRSTHYPKKQRDKAERMFHKILALGGRSPKEAYEISFMTNTEGINSFRKNRAKKVLEEKRNAKK